MELSSQEKTAFVTPHGLRVMPFGLTNAPAVFQRLIQQVLIGLNPTEGDDFVTAYINDILIFSPMLCDHLQHLRQFINRLREVNLKLKLTKCKFVRESVDYLGHVITATGLQTNPRLTDAVQKFPRPENVHDVRRFLGMTSLTSFCLSAKYAIYAKLRNDANRHQLQQIMLIPPACFPPAIAGLPVVCESAKETVGDHTQASHA